MNAKINAQLHRCQALEWNSKSEMLQDNLIKTAGNDNRCCHFFNLKTNTKMQFYRTNRSNWWELSTAPWKYISQSNKIHFFIQLVIKRLSPQIQVSILLAFFTTASRVSNSSNKSSILVSFSISFALVIIVFNVFLVNVHAHINLRTRSPNGAGPTRARSLTRLLAGLPPTVHRRAILFESVYQQNLNFELQTLFRYYDFV